MKTCSWNRKVSGPPFTNFPQTCDSICHDLLTEKLTFSFKASVWLPIKIVNDPQRSILEPLLFSTFLFNLSSSLENNCFTNDIDETPLSVTVNNPEEVISSL